MRRDELATARELVALQHQLSVIAAQTSGPAALTEVLATCLDAPVWLVSDSLAVLAASEPRLAIGNGDHGVDHGPPLVRWDRIFHVASETKSTVRSPEIDGAGPYVVAPVLVDLEEVTAYLVATEPKGGGTDFTLLALEHTAAVCGVMLSRERALAAAAGRARDDLVEGLLLGRASDRDELVRWARHLGLDPTHPHRLLLLAFSAPDGSTPGPATERESRTRQVIRHFCESRGTGVVTLGSDSEVMAIVPDVAARWPSPAELAAECMSYCHDLFGSMPLNVVVSKPCADLSGIPAAHRDVRRASDAFRRLGRHGEVVALEELGFRRLLLHVPDLDELRAFADEVVGPLARYDRDHGSQLLETLVSFFRNGTSVRRVAADLHVHPNTVTYRLKRCCELGGIDLEQYRDRLAVQVALEIVTLVGPTDE